MIKEPVRKKFSPTACAVRHELSMHFFKIKFYEHDSLIFFKRSRNILCPRHYSSTDTVMTIVDRYYFVPDNPHKLHGRGTNSDRDIHIITAKKDETEITRFNFLGKSPTQPNKGITGWTCLHIPEFWNCFAYRDSLTRLSHQTMI
jgi:hypothetical protein